MEHFEKLYDINVNEHVEQKEQGGTKLSYLSWAWAWAEFKKVYPTAEYEIEKFNNLPYVLDPATGYIVYTKVTVEGLTHEMWLPVLDGNNKPMKSEPYEIETKKGKTTVKAATMFDINKTIMRCLTKNLAMFGLGLYIYAGEDLPESDDEEETSKKKPSKKEKEPVKENNREQPKTSLKCSKCGKEIDQKVYDYSVKKFGQPLCFECQANHGVEKDDEEKFIEPPAGLNHSINPKKINVGDSFDSENVAKEPIPEEKPISEKPISDIRLPFDDDGTEPVHVDTLAILEKLYYEQQTLRQAKINEFILKKYNAKSLDELTQEQAQYVINVLRPRKD